MVKLSLIFSILLMLFCTTNTPTTALTSSAGGIGVSISIIQDGKYSANFLGHDLNLIINFQDSVVANLSSVISIHTLGAEIYPTTEIIKKSKVKKLIIPIYWKSKVGLYKDTLDDSMNDSVYVTIYGDETFGESNVVKVKVLNLPATVTAYTVGDSVYSLPGHITDVINYTYTISDSTDSILNLAFTIVDPDNNYTMTWNILSNDTDPSNSGTDSKLLSWKSSTAAKYIVRKSDYIQDIVTAIINDKDKQIDITLKFVKSDGTELKIDSLLFGDTLYEYSSTAHIFKSITLDSIDIVAYAHQAGGVYKWSAGNGIIYSKDADNSVAYKCTSSVALDTIIVDTLIYLDTISLVYYNTIGDDSTLTSVIIIKRPLNSAPTIDSISFASVSQTVVDTAIKYTVEADSTLVLNLFGSDADLETLVYSWNDSKSTGVLSATTGEMVTYTAGSTVGNDTISGIVTDTSGFKDSVDIIIQIATKPLVDSLLLDATIFTTLPATNNVASSDSFAIKLFVSDADLADLLTYSWSYKNVNYAATTASTDSIYYISADSSYADTITVTATDTYGLKVLYTLILNIIKP